MKDYLELLSSVGKLKISKNSILFYEGEEAKNFYFTQGKNTHL